MATKRRILEKWQNQETGYNSSRQLAKHLKLEPKKVQDALDTNETYSRNSRFIDDYTKIKWSAKRVGEIIHCDIMFKNENDKETNNKKNKNGKALNTLTPIFVAVDIYSHYCWITPLPKKKSDREGFNNVIKDLYKIKAQKPFKFVTDGGSELNYIKEIDPENIKLITSKSPNGASVVEGFIQRIRKMMRTIEQDSLPKKAVFDWVKIAKNLNKVSTQVNFEHSPHDIFWKKKKAPIVEQEPDTQAYQVGMFVRKREYRTETFQKGIIPWSKELYRITERIQYNGVYRYKITPLKHWAEYKDIEELYDDDGKKYYYEELLPVDLSFLEKYKFSFSKDPKIKKFL